MLWLGIGNCWLNRKNINFAPNIEWVRNWKRLFWAENKMRFPLGGGEGRKPGGKGASSRQVPGARTPGGAGGGPAVLPLSDRTVALLALSSWLPKGILSPVASAPTQSCIPAGTRPSLIRQVQAVGGVKCLLSSLPNRFLKPQKAVIMSYHHEWVSSSVDSYSQLRNPLTLLWAAVWWPEGSRCNRGPHCTTISWGLL